MNAADMTTELKRFLIDNFVYDESYPFDETASLMEEGVLDSTGVLELIVFLERRFGVKVSDDELTPENLDSIANIINYLRRKLAQDPAAAA